MRPVRDVNVMALIDDRLFSLLQWLVFVLCGLAAFLDGADSQSIGVAAPLIATEFGMPMGSFAPAFSAGLLGATIGALTFGPLGDRFGRKRMLVLAVLLSTFTLLTAVARTFPELLAIRFLGGFGGATPCLRASCGRPTRWGPAWAGSSTPPSSRRSAGRPSSTSAAACRCLSPC